MQWKRNPSKWKIKWKITWQPHLWPIGIIRFRSESVRSVSSRSPSLIFRHVSTRDKVGKLYRQNPNSIFSLDGDDDDGKSPVFSPLVQFVSHLRYRNDLVIGTSRCARTRRYRVVVPARWYVVQIRMRTHRWKWKTSSEVKRSDGSRMSDWLSRFGFSLLLVSATHLYILRKLPEHRTMANLVARRPLASVIKITSKKNVPEIITFRYTTNLDDDLDEEKTKHFKMRSPIDSDKVYLGDAGEATKHIKVLIMKALNLYENETTAKNSWVSSLCLHLFKHGGEKTNRINLGEAKLLFFANRQSFLLNSTRGEIRLNCISNKDNNKKKRKKKVVCFYREHANMREINHHDYESRYHWKLKKRRGREREKPIGSIQEVRSAFVVVALDTTSIHLKENRRKSIIERFRSHLPIKCILTFGPKEIDVIFKLKFENEIFVHAVRFRRQRTSIAEQR